LCPRRAGPARAQPRAPTSVTELRGRQLLRARNLPPVEFGNTSPALRQPGRLRSGRGAAGAGNRRGEHVQRGAHLVEQRTEMVGAAGPVERTGTIGEQGPQPRDAVGRDGAAGHQTLADVQQFFVGGAHVWTADAYRRPRRRWPLRQRHHAPDGTGEVSAGRRSDEPRGTQRQRDAGLGRLTLGQPAVQLGGSQPRLEPVSHAYPALDETLAAQRHQDSPRRPRLGWLVGKPEPPNRDHIEEFVGHGKTCQSALVVTSGNLGAVSLPPWVVSIETKPAPMPLLVVQAFVNTFEADTDIDLLREPEPARRWFTAAGLLDAGHSLEPGELGTARQVRESIRALLVRGAGAPLPTAGDLEPLVTVAQQCQPRLGIDTRGAVHLETNPGPGLHGGWLRILLIIRDAQVDQTWQRLKACGNDECGWAFYDRSHSRRGRWCDMAVCGNRMKNRGLRTRQRDTRATAGDRVPRR